MKDYQAQGPHHGHLREPEAQAAAGLSTGCDSDSLCASPGAQPKGRKHLWRVLLV